MISVCSTHLAAGAHRLRQREAFCKGQAGDVVPQTFQHSRCDSHQACMSSAQSQGLRRRTQQEALLGRAEHRGQSQGRHCAYRLTTGLLADQTPGDLHLNAAKKLEAVAADPAQAPVLCVLPCHKWRLPPQCQSCLKRLQHSGNGTDPLWDQNASRLPSVSNPHASKMTCACLPGEHTLALGFSGGAHFHCISSVCLGDLQVWGMPSTSP